MTEGSGLPNPLRTLLYACSRKWGFPRHSPAPVKGLRSLCFHAVGWFQTVTGWGFHSQNLFCLKGFELCEH